MKLFAQRILCYINHDWNNEFKSLGEIHYCKRCGYTEKLVEIVPVACGGFEFITEALDDRSAANDPKFVPFKPQPKSLPVTETKIKLPAVYEYQNSMSQMREASRPQASEASGF